MNRLEEPIFNSAKIEQPTGNNNNNNVSDTNPTLTNINPISIDFDFKNGIIVTLLIFLILTFLGINIFSSLGDFYQYLSNLFGPFFIRFLKALGYSTGTILNETTEVTEKVAKTGIEITGDAIQNIGNLMKGSGPPPPPPTTDKDKSLEKTVQQKKEKKTESPNEPTPDSSENTIQKPITADKTNWCLVGEYQNKRGCIEISESDKCFSGQVFPSQKMCLNPTWTP